MFTCNFYLFPAFELELVSKSQYIVFISRQWYNCKKVGQFTNSTEQNLSGENSNGTHTVPKGRYLRIKSAGNR